MFGGRNVRVNLQRGRTRQEMYRYHHLRSAQDGDVWRAVPRPPAPPPPSTTHPSLPPTHTHAGLSYISRLSRRSFIWSSNGILPYSRHVSSVHIGVLNASYTSLTIRSVRQFSHLHQKEKHDASKVMSNIIHTQNQTRWGINMLYVPPLFY